MTAQVTWSGRVSVFEVKLFLLYLQDLTEKKSKKNGCTITFLLAAKDHMAKTWSMVIMVIMMTNVDDKTVVRIIVNLF